MIGYFWNWQSLANNTLGKDKVLIDFKDPREQKHRETSITIKFSIFLRCNYKVVYTKGMLAGYKMTDHDNNRNGIFTHTSIQKLWTNATSKVRLSCQAKNSRSYSKLRLCWQ